MQRIDTVDSLFSDGDPQNNVKGTRVTAEILNTWQEEMAGVIEGFGVTLDPDQNDQLFTVLSRRCVQAGDEIQLPYVPTAQQMLDRRMLERNGASLLRTDYPALFTAIGTMYGAVDGTHFSLPDDRGLFLRIFNHGAGIDPDAATRTDRGDGVTGDNVGTKQQSGVGPHTHPIPINTTGTNTGYFGPGSTTPGGAHNSEQNTGSETRPVNRYKWGGIFY